MKVDEKVAKGLRAKEPMSVILVVEFDFIRTQLANTKVIIVKNGRYEHPLTPLPRACAIVIINCNHSTQSSALNNYRSSKRCRREKSEDCHPL